MNHGYRGSRPVGRPPVFADAHVERRGVSLHPAQVARLAAVAQQRGTTVSGVIRDVLTEWEQRTGLVPA